MLQWAARKHRGLFERFFYRDGETPAERYRKDVLLSIHIVSTFVLTAVLPISLAPTPYIILSHCVSYLVLIFPVVWCAVTKSLSSAATGRFVVLSGLRMTVIVHFESYGQGDSWSISVLVMDLLLLLGCHRVLIGVFRNTVLCYLAFHAVLSCVDTGIYDALPTLSIVETHQLISPSRAMVALTFRVFVLCCDFSMTQYFAVEMRKRQGQLESSVQAAHSIASALVDFDLDLARAELGRSDLEDGLRDALGSLLENLQTYRPFLPDALFKQGCAASSLSHSRMPPCGDGVAVAFTDIQSSTAIWDSYPSAMRRAMTVHDEVVRGVIVQHNGYEVKTIGDAFMVAFDSTVDAVLFGVSVQEKLYQASWPEEILEHPLCAPTELWNGLRVRVGIHTGDGVEVQTNPVTGRADYFGPVVNIASRIEGRAHGGVIAMTQAVYDEHVKHLSSNTVRVSVLDVGDHLFKGIPTPVSVVLVAPHHLAGRLLQGKWPVTPAQQDCDSLTTISVASAPPSVLSEPCVMGVVTTLPTADHRMEQSHTSIASIRVDYRCPGVEDTPHAVSSVVEAAVDCAERAKGKILSVCSASIVVAWNVSEPCAGHHVHAARFAGFLKKQTMRTVWAPTMTVGLSTGQVLHGHAGTGSQRFVMVVGQCVELAAALAAAAADLKTFCLAAAVPGFKCVADDPSLSRAARKVDQWKLSPPSTTTTVYEVDVDRVRTLQTGSSDEHGWGWSAEYDQAFTAKDVATIKSNTPRDDAVLSRVALLLTDDTHLECPIPSHTLSQRGTRGPLAP
eukprot:Sspe_Gene.84407::Locus_55410_Transcript_1_1_Confidence_1.000_Length_2410::g.84407::m.84407